MAVAERRILVSKDEDFAFRYPSEPFTLLWLRCGNTTKASLFAWLEPRWGHIERLLEAGERMIEVR